MPIAFTGVIWIISFDNLKIMILPFLGAFLLLSGGGFGLLQARLMNKTGVQKSVLFCWGFPLAKYFKTDSDKMDIPKRLTEVAKEPFFLAATISFVVGLALNLSGLQRPPQYETLNSYFVPIGTFMILLSIGLGMRFSSARKNLKEGLVMAGVKHLCLPVFGAGAAWLLGFHHIENGLPFKIVLICSSMPIAFNGLVVASIYDLDLATTCWIISTLSLIPVVPALYLLFTII